MSFFISVNNVAVYQRALNFFSFKTEWNNFFITRLFIEFTEVHSFFQNTRRSTCLQTTCCKTKSVQTFCKTVSSRFPYTSARSIIFTNKNTTTKEGTGCQNNRTYRNNSATLSNNASYLLTHTTLCSLSSGFPTLFTRNCSLFSRRVTVWWQRSR